jgi:hypothetical protein
VSSRLGKVGVSPYEDDEPAYTTRRTPAVLDVTRRFSAASTKSTLVLTGSATERGAEGQGPPS